MEERQDNGNGLVILIIAGFLFPPLGAFLLLVGVVVLIFGFLDWLVGLFHKDVGPVDPWEIEDHVPLAWTRNR
jgi:hypothetical protein